MSVPKSALHNGQGQATHLLEQIERLSCVEVDFIKPGKRALGHQLAKARDTASMKGWLDQATLREPGVSIAQRHPEHLIGRPSLAVVFVILLHDMAYPIGMKDQGP